MSQHTLTLNCIGSCYTDADNRYSNYPSSVVKTGLKPTSMGGSINKHNGFVKFDDSTLPVRKKIINIKIRYYIQSIQYYLNWAKIQLGYTDTNVDLSTITFDKMATGYYCTNTRDFYTGATIPLYYEETLNALTVKVVSFDSEYNDNYFEISGHGSANPPSLIITYEDVAPDAPSPLDPVGAFKGNANIIRFSWTYNSSVGGIQKAFDLMWSTNGSTWTTVSQTTSNTYYDMPANSLPTGNIFWKVRCYNEYNEVSPESGISAFYATGVPTTPTITSVSTTSARPKVSWSAATQQLYQIQILQGNNIVYDSGSVPSLSLQTHKVTKFLADGTYTAKVRVKNEFDLFSEWASYSFTLYTAKPNKPVLTLSQSKYSVTATSDIAENSYLLLYRSEYDSNNFVCVGKVTVSEIIDYTVENNKQYQYFVRAVSSTETYSDSDISVVTSPQINQSIISPVSDLGNVFEVKYNLNDRPVKNITANITSSTNYFSGRKYAVTEYDEHFNTVISLTFFIKTDTDMEQIHEIINTKGAILYRDGRRKLYGNISGINITDHPFGYAVGFVIIQTDYSEEVEV
jgi:hypothetical protein